MIVRNRAAMCRGAVAVETAIILPILLLLAVIAFDFCRVYQYQEVLANCARAGAVYCSDPNSTVQPPAEFTQYGDYRDAAYHEWPYDAGLLTVSRTAVTDGGNNYYDVTASYTFSTVVSYLGVPSTVNLSRTVRVRVTKPYPNDVSGL
jgi:Flp pilus assembly protein TadG